MCSAFPPQSCGPTFSNCAASGRCECNRGYYFDQLTGTCNPRKVETTACSSNTECIEFAYCGRNTGDTFDRCYCDPLIYYYNAGTQTCDLRQTITFDCTAYGTSTCDFYTQNLRCFDEGPILGFRCGCDPTFEEWDPDYLKCIILKR